jgi:hypothetical protein
MEIWNKIILMDIKNNFLVMRKKKIEIENNIYNDNVVRVSNEGEYCYFEIGKETTMDIGEAVAILLKRKEPFNSEIWKMKISEIKTEISPDKSLFWLTGGYNEWRSLENYNRPWIDASLIFQEEFGLIIISIINRSKTLGDIRDGFIRLLNLPILYDFAIRKNLTK